MKDVNLVLIFNNDYNNMIVLMCDKLENIDKLTSGFNDQNEIIKYFLEPIKEFLKQHNSLVVSEFDIKLIDFSNNKKYIPIIYKKHKDIFENELIENQYVMKRFASRSYAELKNGVKQSDSSICQMSEYISSGIRFYNKGSRTYNSKLNLWKKDLKKSNKYFSTLREVFEMYRKIWGKNIFESITFYKSDILSLLNSYKLIPHNKTLLADFDVEEYDTDYYYQDGFTRNYMDNNPDIYETDCDVDLSELEDSDDYYRKRR